MNGTKMIQGFETVLMAGEILGLMELLPCKRGEELERQGKLCDASSSVISSSKKLQRVFFLSLNW